MRPRHLMTVAVLATAGLLAAACGGSSSSGTSSSGPSGVLTIDNESGGTWTCDFNPFNLSYIGYSMGPIYEPLAFVNTLESGKATPWLATSWTWGAGNKTLTCSSTETLWAWCYGAPCVVDPKDPTKANCNCPVKQSAASTLGGDCHQVACGELWSAATPQADAGANAIFAAYMKKNNPTVPSLPPAEACPATQAPGAR